MPRRWLHTLVLCTLAFVAITIPTPRAFAQTASLSFELEWNSSADLDLTVQQPDGTWIDYNDPSSPSGGNLDASQGNNFCEDASANPREGISWIDNAPTGPYWINISLYDVCGAPEAQSFTLKITSNGQIIEQFQGVVFPGLDNTRIFNFIFPGADAFPAIPAGDVPEAPGGLGGLLGGPTGKPTATPSVQLPLVPDTSPTATPGPIEMGGESEVPLARGPMRVQLTWSTVPNFDLDLMAKELGTMISYDQPTSASGAVLTEDYGNSLCANRTLPDRDLYGEEIDWSAEPIGSTVEVYVALIGICGPAGFVLPGEEVAHFTLTVYNAEDEVIYGPVQGTTDADGSWSVTFRFAE